MKNTSRVLLVAALLTACGGAHSTGPNVPKEAQKEHAETNLVDADAGLPDVGDPSPK